MKFKRVFKKILIKTIDFCTAPMFEVDEEAENEELAKDFNARKMYFLKENSKKIIKDKFIPEIQKKYLKETDLLITDIQALPEAVQKFLLFKQLGKIDYLNNLTEVD